MEERFIHSTALVGEPLRFLQGCIRSTNASQGEVDLPDICYIGPYSIVGMGTKLGERVIVDSYVSIDPGVVIGDDTILIYRATVGGGAKIGKKCVIGGFIPEGTIIGDRCRILGTLTHVHNDPAMNWDHHESPENAPHISSDCFVGLGSLIIGGVKLGPKSYVCAGAQVKEDVPGEHIVSRSGHIFHYSEWEGKLRKSSFFGDGK